MAALVIIETVVVGLLTLLVAGLLRSHAEILRLLHHLGVDYQAGEVGGPTHRRAPHEARHGAGVADISGVTPSGDALVVGASHPQARILVLFLSSGCEKCHAFWEALSAGAHHRLGVRVLVVTRGPEHDSPGLLQRWSIRGIEVVMSSQAWDDFAVPGSPYIVLCDGGAVAGEGTASSWTQLESLIAQAALDQDAVWRERPAQPRRAATGTRAPAHHRSGDAERERRADRELMAAGIEPGDPRLFPGSTDEVA